MTALVRESELKFNTPLQRVRAGTFDLPLLLILVRYDNILLDIIHQHALRDLY